MLTIAQSKELLKSKLDKATFKRLRPLFVTKSFKRIDGHYIALHLPAFINIAVNEHFSLTENSVTYSFKNDKVCVTVWKDERVTAHVTVY